jgi:hypothetical protein
MTASLSNGWISTAPVEAITCCSVAMRAASVGSQSTMSAP